MRKIAGPRRQSLWGYRGNRLNAGRSCWAALLFAAFLPTSCAAEEEGKRDANDAETINSECSSPYPGCPCELGVDEGCCLAVGIGIECIGIAQAHWVSISGCGCGAPSCADFSAVELCPGSE